MGVAGWGTTQLAPQLKQWEVRTPLPLRSRGIFTSHNSTPRELRRPPAVERLKSDRELLADNDKPQPGREQEERVKRLFLELKNSAE